MMILFMKEIRRSPVDMVNTRKYHTIYRVLYIPGGAGFLPSTVDLFFGWVSYSHWVGDCRRPHSERVAV